MQVVFEPASSGRARCRGCARPIPRGELRFGERMANPFGDGEMTLWFHPACAAYKRPEPFLRALAQTDPRLPEHRALERAARASLAHRRLPRIDGAQRAPSSQAKCRHCREPIERETWRIRLVFYEEGQFSAGGYVHLRCRKAYFETDDLVEQLLHFSPMLSEPEREALKLACDAAGC